MRIFAGLLLSGILVAQDIPVSLRSETRVVQIEVFANDSGGHPVSDLSQRDFTIEDEGKARPFQIFSVNRSVDPTPAARVSGSTLPGSEGKSPSARIFSNRTAAPAGATPHRTIIVIDCMNGWFENYAWARRGVIGLLDKVSPGEQIAIYAIAARLGLVIVQDYTSDHEALLSALQKYIPKAMSPGPPGIESLRGAMVESPNPVVGGTSPNAMKPTPREEAYSLREASEGVRLSLKTLAERLAGLPGRKSVFWMTQGFPPSQIHDNRAVWADTFRELNEANVAVNTIDTNAMGGPDRRWGKNSGAIGSLQVIAEETGGTAYFHRNDLDGALAQGIENSRANYTLAFYLRDDERDNRFHRLRVAVDRRGVELHYRLGYYSGVDPQLESSGKKAEPESVLVSPVDTGAVGIQASASLTGGRLNLKLTLETASLTLKPTAAGWLGSVEETFLQMNAQGNQLAQVKDVKQFEIPRAARAAYERRGVEWPQSFPLAAGAVKVTIVIRDVASGRLGSLTLLVAEIPVVAGK